VLQTASVDKPRKPNALFNANKLKLGLFGINCDSGCAMTLVDERLHLTWESTKKIAQIADQSGFEALVPVSRWKGLGGPTNFNGRNFETYVWAAGLAEATQNITLVTTSHVQVTHPITAAKQAATIDHISGGRYALNIVCGWFHRELEMFGAPFLEHDARYDYAIEWYDIVRRLWTEDGQFNYEGKYFKVDEGFGMPKPLQGKPPVINAGGSPRGRDFIASHCEIGYVLPKDYDNLEKSKPAIDEYRALAASKGRALQIWTHCYVVQRDTREEARRYLEYFTGEKGNDEAAQLAADYLGLNTGIFSPEQWQSYKVHLKAGYGGYPLVGTAASITEQLHQLSEIGIDGVAIHWVDYLDGLHRFLDGVMPRLQGLRLRTV
jgi:dimethylsulfone monooxygenase